MQIILLTQAKEKIIGLIISWIFKIRFRIYRGTIRFDFASIEMCKVGRHAIIRGKIECKKSTLHIGDNLSLAESAEMGAEEGTILVGDKVSIGPRTILSTTRGRIKIGNGTTFFSDCIVSGHVEIGEGCLFAKNVTILSSGHQIHGNGTIRENDYIANLQYNNQRYEPVTFGNDCWLGSNAVILPGISLAEGVIVGANAVVTKNFPAYSIIAGVPAQLIGTRIRNIKNLSKVD